MSRAVVECDQCGLPAQMDGTGTVLCAVCGRMQRAAREGHGRAFVPAGLMGLDPDLEADLRAFRGAMGCDDA